MYKVNVFSRHPSHRELRRGLPEFEFRSLVRLGSTTPTKAHFPISVKRGLKIVEINSVEAVTISANKLLMKEKFREAVVKTAPWLRGMDIMDEDNHPIDFPIVAKHIFGSRGRGNYLLKSAEELETWIKGKTLSNYIFEAFLKGYNREYRIHVSTEGEFYSCRKMLRNDTPEEQRWSRHTDNSVWVLPENPKFDRPVNWDDIVVDCGKALQAIGADVLAFDVKVQSAIDRDGERRENPKWAILESNSAPSLATIGTQKYIEHIPLLINKKENKI